MFPSFKTHYALNPRQGNADDPCSLTSYTILSLLSLVCDTLLCLYSTYVLSVKTQAGFVAIASIILAVSIWGWLQHIFGIFTACCIYIANRLLIDFVKVSYIARGVIAALFVIGLIVMAIISKSSEDQSYIIPTLILMSIGTVLLTAAACLYFCNILPQTDTQVPYYPVYSLEASAGYPLPAYGLQYHP